MSKCSLDPKSIYKDKNNNYRFILDFSKIDESLKDKISKLNIFKENSFKNDNTIHGSYNFNESKAKTIYEVKCFNMDEYSNTKRLQPNVNKYKAWLYSLFYKIKKITNFGIIKLII